VTTPAQHAWSLGYDGQGRLTTISSPVSGTLGQTGYTPAYTTQLTYGATTTQVIRGLGDSGTLTTTTTLDALGQATQTQDGLGHTAHAAYDADHDVTSSSDANGNTTTDKYQYIGPNGAVGQVIEEDQPPIQPYSPQNGVLVSPVITHTYDPATHDLLATGLPEGGLEKDTYDGHHGMVASSEQSTLPCAAPPCPVTWRGDLTLHDTYGEITGTIDGRGVHIDASGAVTPNPTTALSYTIHLGYNVQGDLTSESMPPIMTTQGSITTTAPVTTTYIYDADGNRQTLVSANGNTTIYGYDHLRRSVTMTLPAFTLYNGTTTQPIETIGYDSEGNVVRETDGNGNTTTSSYDPIGRLVAQTNPVSGTTSMSYNANEIVSNQDPQGNAVSYSYDTAGRMVAQTNAVTGTVQYAYDAVGNTVSMTTTDRGSAATIVQESMGYDAHNRVITDTVVTDTAHAAASPLTTLIRFDQDGNVAQTVRPNGDIAYDTYDAADRLIGVEIAPTPLTKSGSTTHARYESYGYDGAGNTTSFVDADGRTTIAQYDGADRIVQGVSTSSDVSGTTVITTTKGYDPDGNSVNTATTTQKPSGAIETHAAVRSYNAVDWEVGSRDDGYATTYGYDAVGQMRGETSADGMTSASAGYDPEGRITSISENASGTGPFTSQFTYATNDLLRATTYPNGAQESRGYDPNNELTSLIALGPTMSTVTDTLNTAYAYSYNVAGWTISTTTISGTDQITHDAAGRIVADCGPQVIAMTPDHCYRWTYDMNGNVATAVSDDGTVLTYGYNPAIPNQLQTVSSALGTPTTYYGYDGSGDTRSITNTLAMTNPQSNDAIDTHITYDAQARPIGITKLDSGTRTTITLGYNAEGERARYTVSVSGTVTVDERFSYRDNQLAQVSTITATLNADGSVKSTGQYTDTYIYGPTGEPLEFLRNQSGVTNRYWYVLDGQRSVVAVADVNGKVVDRYNYDSWGEPIGKDYQTVQQPLRYAGYWWDGEVQWYWAAVRYDDPDVEHWLQPDPSDLDGVHTYVYCGDDPVDYIDPSGLQSGGDENNVSQDVIDRLIQRLRDTWVDIVNPREWAPGKQRIDYYIGGKAHAAIGAYYLSQNPYNTIFLNYYPISSILRSSFGYADPAAVSSDLIDKKPDILDATERIIYEIKSRNTYADAVPQRDMYIKAFTEAGVTIRPGPTAQPGVNGILPAPGGYFVFFAPQTGVILYTRYPGKFQPKAGTEIASDVDAKLAAALATAAAIAATVDQWLGGGIPVPEPIPLPAA